MAGNFKDPSSALVSRVDPAPGGAAALVRDFGRDYPAGPGQAETGQLCTSCRSLAIVKQQGLSRDSRDELLDWMIEEQGVAEQSPERRRLILDYRVTHFGIPDWRPAIVTCAHHRSRPDVVQPPEAGPAVARLSVL